MSDPTYDCSRCGTSPCRCDEFKQRVLDGKVVLENLWKAMTRLPHWKMKIVKWLWPDFTQVANDFLDYYWADRKEKDE